MTDQERAMRDLPTEALAATIVDFNDRLPQERHQYEVFRLAEAEFCSRSDRRDHYRALLEGLLKWGIRHPDVLHLYIRLFLGYDLPRHAYCKKRGHVAPFSFVRDVFFEQVRSAIAFANRTGGKTMSVAILNHLNMMFKPYCEIVSAGAILDQANKAYQYFTEFHLGNELLNERLVKEPTRSYSVYKNLSSLKVITGSMASFNGPHPNKVNLDEVELMDWDVLQQGMSMAMTTDDPETGRPIEAQLVMSSTRKYDTGTMQRLLDLAKADTRKRGGFKIYEWCALEVLERCARKCKKDPYYGDCPVYGSSCRGRAHHCRGWYKIDDFIDKTIMLDKDVLDREWFNLKPSRQLYVYGDYWRREKHVIPPREFGQGHIEYIGSIDFGATQPHPFVFKIYACDCTDFKREIEEAESPNDVIRAKIAYYTVYEYRSGGGTLEVHAAKIKAHSRWTPAMPIWADPSAKQERVDLEEIHGIPTYPAINAVEAGISNVKTHLQFSGGRAHYYIFEGYLDCDDSELIGSDVEFERYKYRRFKDGKVNRKEPEPINDHGMDCDRYAISSSIPYFREKFTPLYEDVEEDGYWFGR